MDPLEQAIFFCVIGRLQTTLSSLKMEPKSLKEGYTYPNKMNTIIDQLLNFYGARTSGSYERKLERVVRFVKASETAPAPSQSPQQSATGKKGVKRDRNGDPVASRTRSQQPVAARTRSQTQH